MKFKFSRYTLFLLFIFVISLALSSCTGPNQELNTNPPTAPPDPQPTTEQTPTESPAPAGDDRDIAEILASLSNLPIDAFFENSFTELGFRYPEDLVEQGIDVQLGVPVTLNNLSEEYLLETMELESGMLAILLGYDLDSLTPEQQTSYQVYKWYLEDIVDGHPFSDYQYIASYMILNSVHNQTNMFFTETHPVNDLQQAENFITRLSLLDEKFEQLVASLQSRADQGLIPPRFSIDWALSGLRGQTRSFAVGHPFYTAFRNKLQDLEELSDDQIDALLEKAAEAIETSVLPAYDALIAELERQRTLASDAQMGVSKFDKGEEYYAYLLKHYTTTDLTADQIHQLGLDELERIHAEMRVIFDQLGYPEDENLETLFARVAKDGGIIPSGQAVETYEQIIADTNLLLDQAFEISPQADVIVIGGASGGYYVRGSLDGSRPGAFYAGISGGGEPFYKMHSLCYHETIPGHHFQIELAREMNLPTFRNTIGIGGFVEGWALYAERLASDLGWYADDPYSDLGRLQYEALRAARLVVDTGLHTKQWSFDQAVEFFMENVGWSRGASEYQIARYIVVPGQATGYMIGMLQILDLRQQAIDKLGSQFDLIEFHSVILDGGALPLSILADKVDAYIAAKLAD
jgi:uncharacterized protein (DUF885 family)